jgi:ABC-type branched-subunit amino acid transport system ATPase component
VNDTPSIGSASASPVVVTARGVVKRYGRTVALAGLDAEIGTGIKGLLGSNGAGKTTEGVAWLTSARTWTEVQA